MLFTFLKYVQPTHYFRSSKNNGESIFPIVEKLPLEVVNQLTKDESYTSDNAKTYDYLGKPYKKDI